MPVRQRGAPPRGAMIVDQYERLAMKPKLQLKIAIVLGYVALCTMLVLSGQQADAPAQEGLAPPASLPGALQ
jgi:hypothetical protein